MGRRGLSDVSEEMQFELRVLEVVLDYVTAFMEHLSSDLEAVAYPGLDAIVAKVNMDQRMNVDEYEEFYLLEQFASLNKDPTVFITMS